MKILKRLKKNDKKNNNYFINVIDMSMIKDNIYQIFIKKKLNFL